MTKQILIGQDDYVGKWVCLRAGGQYSGGTTVGLTELRGAFPSLIAGVMYDQFNGASICMHVAAEPGKRWMTREYLWFCFYYPFVQLGVQKIIGLVPAANEIALRFDKHLGFEEEHRIRDAHPRGDLVILSMTREQCRFLEIRNGKRICTSSP